MELIPLKSPRLRPGADLLAALQSALQSAKQKLKSGDVLVIASKVVAYSENRLAPVKSAAAFRALVRQEADKVYHPGDMALTLKNGILIPNAGIDRSNVPDGQVVLWPRDSFRSAQKIRATLTKTTHLRRLGVVISDSHCQPMRRGTTGIAIGWAGIEGVLDVRGAKDLFGRQMTYTEINVADDLASAANLLMGETNASTPFVLVRGAPVKFTTKKASSKDYAIAPRRCLFAPLMRML